MQRNLEEVYDLNHYLVAIFRVAEPAQLAVPAKLEDLVVGSEPPKPEKYVAIVPGVHAITRTLWYTSITLFGLKGQMESDGVILVDWENAEETLSTSSIYKQYVKEKKPS